MGLATESSLVHPFRAETADQLSTAENPAFAGSAPETSMTYAIVSVRIQRFKKG